MSNESKEQDDTKNKRVIDVLKKGIETMQNPKIRSIALEETDSRCDCRGDCGCESVCGCGQ